MDFGTLKTRISGLIGRAPADICYELATADINQELKTLGMETTATLTEAASIALPSGFREVVSVYRGTDPRTALTPTDTATLNRGLTSGSVPTRYAIVDGAMLLGPIPNGSEAIELRYYADLADLSADTDTNEILTRYPSVYVYGVLAHHAAGIKDETGLPMWFAAYEKAKNQARKDDRARRMGGLPATPVARGAV